MDHKYRFNICQFFLCSLLFVFIFDVIQTGNVFGLWGSMWCIIGATSTATYYSNILY